MLFVFHLRIRGIPKYLPRLVTMGILAREAIWCCTSVGVLGEKNSFDLEVACITSLKMVEIRNQ